jgi:hypothetical protein
MTYEFPCPDVVEIFQVGLLLLFLSVCRMQLLLLLHNVLYSLLLMWRGESNIGSGSISSFMISLTVGLFVGPIPFLIICMCPIVIDIDSGRFFLIVLLANPGKDVSQSLSIALQSVVSTGSDPIAALRYAFNFAIVG